MKKNSQDNIDKNKKINKAPTNNTGYLKNTLNNINKMEKVSSGGLKRNSIKSSRSRQSN